MTYTDSQVVRLSAIDVNLLPGYWTKSGFKKAIKSGRVCVNNAPGASHTWVRPGDVITVEDALIKSTPSLSISIDIIYQDDAFAVVNKPAGIPVSGNKFRTLYNALPSALPISKSSHALSRPHPVHRLDYGTSGCLLVARTAPAEQYLMSLFKTHHVQKTYLAICIGKTPNNFSNTTSIDGKDSATTFLTLATISSPKYENISLVKCSPQTGRRHQIRIHLSQQGHPILGDIQYTKEHPLLKGKGLFLHAHSITFIPPKGADFLTVKSPIPKKFIRFFEILKEQQVQ